MSICWSLLLFTLVIPSLRAESGSSWRLFKAADGLPEAACTTVTISQRTNIWVSHLQSGLVSGFDGYKVTEIPAPETGPVRLYQTPGGQLWAIASDGVQTFENQQWVHYRIEEVRQLASTNALGVQRQTTLLPLRQGELLICLPTGLLLFSDEPEHKTVVLRRSAATKIGRFSDMVTARDGGVWIAAANGIGRIKGPLRSAGPDLAFEEFMPPSELHVTNFQRPFEDVTGSITVIAETADRTKTIVSFDGEHWKAIAAPPKIRSAWRDEEGALWAMTTSSVLKQEPGAAEFVEDQEISAMQFFDATLEPNGAFWVATSDGLYRHSSLTWKTPAALKQINVRVHGIVEDEQHNLWLASSAGLHCFDGAKVTSYAYPETVETVFRPTDKLWLLRDKLLMNFDGKLLQFDLTGHTFAIVPHELGPSVNIVGVLKESLCCTVVNPTSGTITLQAFDGKDFSKIVDLPDKSEVTSFLVARTGAFWVGTANGVEMYDENGWKKFMSGSGLVPDSGFALAENNEGSILSGSAERIWEYDGKSWTTICNGLERVNTMRKASDGTCWVGSNNGLRRVKKHEWLLNSIEDGLSHPAVSAIFEDSKARLWVGTAHGVSLFIPSADMFAPETSASKLNNEQSNLPEDSVTIVFRSRDRWKMTTSDRLLYSYRLDELEWSSWSLANSVGFPNLGSGKHYFQVRSMDRNWNVDPSPAVLEFSITLPWYLETRLVAIAIIGCGVACFFAVLAYNRHRKLVRSYAEIEKIVALRTTQLEKANRELLHSQKMTALGTLSAGIAHDFNNILSIIKGSAQIIESNLEDQEKVRTRVSRIKMVVEQGSGIVKAMLGFSRGAEAQLTTCDINSIAEETIKLLGDRFLRELEIRFERAPNLPPVCASKELLQQVLLNFIFNAADATNGSGKIILRTSRATQLTDYVALPPAAAPEYVVVGVEDFGCGITAEIMPRIFEPFFTTKAFSARRGTGLGLSMVYELAKQMNCGLTVKSQPAVGSTFCLFLPLVSANKTDNL